MKVTLGQINTTPNDFSGNLTEITKGIAAAGKENSDLVIFPELSIPGYLCKDLLYRKGFLARNLASLTQICDYSKSYPGLTIVVGYVGKNITRPGKPFTNMAAVIKNGLALSHYQKQLLPFYDVFDEGRYFEPGQQPVYLEIAGHRCLLTICEDIWNDKGEDGYNYDHNPIANINSNNVDVIINLSSSPYTAGKPLQRFKMLSNISDHHKAAIIYVNQIGGQDELVFDGRSCVFVKGDLVYQIESTKLTTSQYQTVIFDPHHAPLPPREDKFLSRMEILRKANPPPIKEIYNSLIIGLRDYIIKSGFSQVVLGSSGGIDSAVVAALACDAIGPNNVHCIMMPSIFSSEGSVMHAQELHNRLGCNQYTVPIEHQHLVKSINSYFPKQMERNYNSVADENIQARLRGLTVMHASNAFGYLPLTTGNKTELALGYCTLYGDMDGGFNPIGDLYKDQVYAIANHINTGEIILSGSSTNVIPDEIINKPPSAELAKDQTDEKGLGASYSFLNAVVKAFIELHIDNFETFKNHILKAAVWPNHLDHSEKDFVALMQMLEDPAAKEQYIKLIRRIDYMEFKRRQAAPTIKVSSVAFGTGRRLPIVQKVS